MTQPSTSAGELGVFLKRAGFSLTPEEVAEYLEAYRYIEAMAARLRRERSIMAEPAHVFGDIFAGAAPTGGAA